MFNRGDTELFPGGKPPVPRRFWRVVRHFVTEVTESKGHADFQGEFRDGVLIECDTERRSRDRARARARAQDTHTQTERAGEGEGEGPPPNHGQRERERERERGREG